MNSDNVLIETERLYVKKLDRDDYSSYYSQQKDPFIMAHFGGPREEIAIQRIFDLVLSHQEKYGFSVGLILSKQTEEVIGRAGLVHLDFKPVEDVEFGCFLFESHCCKGYATELWNAWIKYAFSVLNVSKVYATVDPNNIAACRAAEKQNLILEKQDFYETLNKTVNFYIKTKEQYLKECLS